MKLASVPALHAVGTTHAGSCPLFAADRPTFPYIQVEDFHHPVHRPQGGFPEVVEHGRGPCEGSRTTIGIYYFLKETFTMGIIWFLVAFGLWIVLQVYVLPKLGVST